MIECSGCIQTSGVWVPKSIPGGLMTTIERPDFECEQFFQNGFNCSLISIRLEALKPELMLATATNSLSVKRQQWVFFFGQDTTRIFYLTKFFSVLPPSTCRRTYWMDCNIHREPAGQNRWRVHRCTETIIVSLSGKIKISFHRLDDSHPAWFWSNWQCVCLVRTPSYFLWSRPLLPSGRMLC